VTQLSWYTQRASLAAVYTTAGNPFCALRTSTMLITVAELHQLASPQTAYDFLDSLLDNYTSLRSSMDEVGVFSSYVARSWAGIIKSSGIF
jgi:ubiquinone biosynthesis protein COQ9